MGTRADYYIRNINGDMRWLGSTAWDGYPIAIHNGDGIGMDILGCTSGEEFESAVINLLNNRHDATHPEDGWPWPWSTSHMTDYSYVWDEGEQQVIICNWGVCGRLTDDWEWPDMEGDVNVVINSHRSGLLVF